MICANCGEREAFGQWSDDPCPLCTARHGINRLPYWCEPCMVSAQVAHLERQVAHLERHVAQLAERQQRLTELEKQDDPKDPGVRGRL